MKVFVEIPEVHKVQVEVEVPDDATREQIIQAATDKTENDPVEDFTVEYDHRYGDDEYEWTIRDEAGKYMNENGEWWG